MNESMAMAALSVAISTVVSLSSIEKASQNVRQGSMDLIGETVKAREPLTIIFYDEKGPHTLTLGVNDISLTQFRDDIHATRISPASSEESPTQESW